MNQDTGDFKLLKLIELAGPTQEVDFADPENAFMVWADYPTGVQYCGGRATLGAASTLAAEHEQMKGLLCIVKTDPINRKPIAIMRHKG